MSLKDPTIIVLKHNCGGRLIASPVWLFMEPNSTWMEQHPGFICDTCGECLIAREVARTLQSRAPASRSAAERDK